MHSFDFASIIPLVLTSILPIDDASMKLHMSMLLSPLLLSLADYVWPYMAILRQFFTQNQIILSDGSNNDHGDALYDSVEEYLVKRYTQDIKTYRVKSHHGTTSLAADNVLPMQFTVTTDAGQSINVQMDTSESKRRIIFTSKLSPADMHEYIKSIASQNTVCNNKLTIFRSMLSTASKKKEASAYWDITRAKTNKTRNNTIYSRETEVELFDDIQWWSESEAWYAQRGIPYKRSYFLEGLPGTGKTSVAKIVANKYSMPIFALDLGAATSNSQLTALSAEINSFARDKRYILLIEDLDRSSLFTSNRRRRRGWDDDDDESSGQQSDLTMDCFLSFLDGVVEANGCLCFITANDRSVLEMHPAVCRPGRIDKTITFGNCTTDQCRRLLELFYGEEGVALALEQGEYDLDRLSVTPADMVKAMQCASQAGVNVDQMPAEVMCASVLTKLGALAHNDGSTGEQQHEPMSDDAKSSGKRTLRNPIGRLQRLARNPIGRLQRQSERALADVRRGAIARRKLDRLKDRIISMSATIETRTKKAELMAQATRALLQAAKNQVPNDKKGKRMLKPKMPKPKMQKPKVKTTKKVASTATTVQTVATTVATTVPTHGRVTRATAKLVT
jgi:chaperone BCS1